MQRKFTLYVVRAVPFAGFLYLLSLNQGVWLAILLTSARSGQASMIFTLDF